MLAASVAAVTMFAGSWHLDRARSRLSGVRTTIARVPHGYRFDFGAIRFTVADDGKDHPTVPTRTTSIKQIGPHMWLRVHKADGRVVDRSVLTVARHALHIRTVATAPDGSRKTTDEILTRIGNGDGLAGTWRSRTVGTDVSARFTVSAERDGRLRIAYPDEGQYYDVVPNGGPAPLHGPRAVPGVTLLLRRVSDTMLRSVESVGGKPYQDGTFALSPDGAILRETTWQANDPSDKQDAVYVKR